MALPQLIVTALYYACAVGVCELGRRLGDKIAPSYSWLYVEFFATLQRCLLTLEGFAIFRAYGEMAFLVLLAATVYLTAKTVRNGAGNPTPYIEERLVDKSISNQRLYIIIGAQIVAALLAFQGARLFWSMGFTSYHQKRLQVAVCNSDLHVSLLYGMACEFIATFVCRVAEHQLPRWVSEEASLIIECVLISVIVAIGMDHTGMYFNPILAFCLTFGCEGLSNIGHLFVYWVGPILGWISATFLCNMITTAERPKTE